MTRRLRTAAATLLVAAAGAVAPLLPAEPAAAATCAAGGGVSVVVDFNDLGGGVVTVCVTDGGGKAASTVVADAGFELTRAQKQPGFVCRVQGVPADDPCVNTSPADAYWGLWWSDGTDGAWTYSSLGVDSLKVPDGGSIGFAWDDVDGQVKPGATPPKKVAASASSSPTSKPSASAGGSSPTRSPSGSVSAPGATEIPMGTALPYSATPDADGRDKDGNKHSDKNGKKGRGDGSDEASPSATASDSGGPSDQAAADGTDAVVPAAADTPADGGLPVWVAPVAVLVLAIGAGVAALLRRRGRA